MLDLCKRLRKGTIMESIRSSSLGLVDPWKQGADVIIDTSGAIAAMPG
jgi:hypothetical protein